MDANSQSYTKQGRERSDHFSTLAGDGDVWKVFTGALWRTSTGNRKLPDLGMWVGVVKVNSNRSTARDRRTAAEHCSIRTKGAVGVGGSRHLFGDVLRGQ